MEWLGALELKKLFTDFFQLKNHLELKSFSLVPEKDSSLLFINSGMAPMKNWFLDNSKAPKKRVVTVQRCIRTADLNLVGNSARHGTFFEMLGNFSFGDYFKREAIFWAFDFVINKLKIPEEKIYVTTYEKDGEAYNIWEKEIGVLNSHIVRLGKKDNFWEIGLGPCGPCSEIYYDRGERYGCNKVGCAPGCDCERFIEFWNLVFSQYENKGPGCYEELKQKNIDTGMGLERLAVIMQNVENIFEVDTVKEILEKVCSVFNVKYGVEEGKDVLVRVLTDHIRSIVFLICDGVLPSNEGRGYVLRKLIRRAHNSGRKLKKGSFLVEVSEAVVKSNVEIKNRLEYVNGILKEEESSFEDILKSSENKLFSFFEKAREKQCEKFIENFDECFEKFKSCLNAFKNRINLLFERLKSKFDEIIKRGFSDKDEYEFKKIFQEFKNNYFFIKISFEVQNIFNKKELENVLKIKRGFEEIEKFLDWNFLKDLEKEEIAKTKEEILKYFEEFCFFVEKNICYFQRLMLNFLKKREASSGSCLVGMKNIFKIFSNTIFLKDFEKQEISSENAFKLCDTYGMPFELLNELVLKNGFCVNKEGFLKLLKQQKQKSKEMASFKNKSWIAEKNELEKLPKTEFVGYCSLNSKSFILEVVKVKKKECFLEDEVDVVFNKTPIYATSGGQQADKGLIYDEYFNEKIGEVLSCEKLETGQFVHRVKLFKRLEKGFCVNIKVHETYRKKIARNHTAAHILQKALILQFKEGVFQAGQQISDKKLRFDFTCFKDVGYEDLQAVEEVVNDVIFKGLDVVVKEMDIKQAKQEGAIALFSEKYGEIVRVVDIVGFSKELCGGTHVKNTNEIGIFKIVSFSSIGSGVKRIEAITCLEVLEFLKEQEKILNKICNIFKVKKYFELEKKVTSLVLELKKSSEDGLKFRLESCKNKFLSCLKENVVKFKEKGVEAVVFYEEVLEKNDMRFFADWLKDEWPNLVVLIFAKLKEKFNIFVVCSSRAVESGVFANDLVKLLAKLADGKGGGKKDFASAGLYNFNKKEEVEKEFFRHLGG